MNSVISYNFPSKIICLTEEAVEVLHFIHEDHRIAGVSAFVKRPEAATKHPKVSFFTSSNYKKINQIAPDLILGHSDIQKDIARDLIEQGHNVFIANHRTLQGILNYCVMLASLVGAREKGFELVKKLQELMQEARDFANSLPRKPVVYFEEWDDPTISCIGWVCEILELCGAKVLFADKSQKILAKERIISQVDLVKLNPDIIFGCWCGKKVNIQAITGRAGWDKIEAVKNGMVFELAPEIFLQPGPAPILDGIEIIKNHFEKWVKEIEK